MSIKGWLFLKLGEIFGISREEIAAFGDGSNDTMMLKTVGMGSRYGECNAGSEGSSRQIGRFQ